MASPQSNAHSEPAKMEQIINEFFAKSLHIILESRSLYVSSRNSSCDPTVTSPSSSSSSSPSIRPRNKWFNLALRECPAALENTDLWRQSNLDPIVVDVILMKRQGPASLSPIKDLGRWNADQEELGVEAKSEKIVERWVLQYESRKARESNSSSRRSSSNSCSLYKKLTLLLRSLYASVRLLPAHKIFRDLNSSGQVLTFTLFHRVSSFAEPFNRKEDAEMLKFGFTPVDTSCGRLCLSVKYRPSVSDVSSEPSTPISPRLITDYVGSPLTEPLRRFQSSGLPSHGSPSSLPFSRRHSWSFDRCRASPPSIVSSPSPTHSEPRRSVSNVGSRRFPPSSLPPHPPEISIGQKNKTFDEYYPSPIMSPSPSPSPPIYSHGCLLSRALKRSESAPVNIPTANVANCSKNAHRHDLLPSPSRTDRGLNMIQYGATAEKLPSLGRDESKRSSGLTASHALPHISFSRCSSRSYQDDSEDHDFTCPFDVDDVDMIDPSSRLESLDHGHMGEMLETGGLYPIRKSQDAAVGALVHMLKKAPPLRQDSCTSEEFSEGARPQTYSINTREDNQILESPISSSMISSEFSTRRTTAEALEEFQGYKEMKNSLLMPGSKPYS
ncbi:hypothetical protein K1719_015168 [Acacia pycnantha]|nr:hypothetical protein K1719_015168 [Acacia pycnantha]